jgi:hypothetical protein
VDRYGPELEYDLAQLAVADDDDPAEAWLAAHGDPRDEVGRRRAQAPTRAEFDYTTEALANVTDLLQELHATLIAANSKGGKRPKVSPMPRPRTALDRALYRADLTVAEGVREAFSPRKD